MSNPYSQNQYPYRTSYSSDIAQLSDVTRQPNYNFGYSTTRPDIYNPLNSGSVYQKSAYTTPNYGYGQGYYGQNYGSGMTSYEMPFMKYNNNNEYCVNRSPQNGIYVDSLTGMWYGVEFIHHLGGDSRLDYGNTCIVIHISEPHDKVSFFFILITKSVSFCVCIRIGNLIAINIVSKLYSNSLFTKYLSIRSCQIVKKFR